MKILKTIDYRDLQIGQQVQAVTTAPNLIATAEGRVHSTENGISILIGNAKFFATVWTQPEGAEVTFSLIHELPDNEGSLVLVDLGDDVQPVRLWAGRWRLLSSDAVENQDVINGYVRTLWDPKA